MLLHYLRSYWQAFCGRQCGRAGESVGLVRELLRAHIPPPDMASAHRELQPRRRVSRVGVGGHVHRHCGGIHRGVCAPHPDACGDELSGVVARRVRAGVRGGRQGGRGRQVRAARGGDTDLGGAKERSVEGVVRHWDSSDERSEESRDRSREVWRDPESGEEDVLVELVEEIMDFSDRSGCRWQRQRHRHYGVGSGARRNKG
mmetsp:Transcript_27713/g.69460  ORF Transcript_27713/g.69460 Transcript_27713/m.69460 type:complete len:202 (+) Transcript_27713:572-1177(+)